MMQARLLAHLEFFEQAYARNCEVRRIEKSEAEAFLKENHSYGYAACKYRYGLFLKRHTGHIAAELSAKYEVRRVYMAGGVASSTFIRNRISQYDRLPDIVFGEPALSGDNAVGTAFLAAGRYHDAAI